MYQTFQTWRLYSLVQIQPPCMPQLDAKAMCQLGQAPCLQHVQENCSEPPAGLATRLATIGLLSRTIQVNKTYMSHESWATYVTTSNKTTGMQLRSVSYPIKLFHFWKSPGFSRPSLHKRCSSTRRTGSGSNVGVLKIRFCTVPPPWPWKMNHTCVFERVAGSGAFVRIVRLTQKLHLSFQ